jgi:DNA-binding NarL/FixJ family response regulator
MKFDSSRLSKTNRVKIAIVEKNVLLCECIASAVRSSTEYQVREFTCVSDLREAFKEFEPDLIIVDDSFVNKKWCSRKNCNALSTECQRKLTCKIILMVGDIRRLQVKDLVNKGVKGLYPKSSNLTNLILSIKTVLAGKMYFGPEFGQKTTNDPGSTLTTRQFEPQLLFNQKERIFLETICAGKSKKDAAAILNVSIRTIERLRRTLNKKTQTRTFAELISFSMKNHLLSG